MKTKITIVTVENHGADTKKARHKESGVTATSTSSWRTAVERVAIKVKTGRTSVEHASIEGEGITVRQLTAPWQWEAEWETV